MTSSWFVIHTELRCMVNHISDFEHSTYALHNTSTWHPSPTTEITEFLSPVLRNGKFHLSGLVHTLIKSKYNVIVQAVNVVKIGIRWKKMRRTQRIIPYEPTKPLKHYKRSPHALLYNLGPVYLQLTVLA